MIILAAFLAQGKIGGYPRQRATESGLPRLSPETILLFGVLVVITLALLLLAYILNRKRHRGLSRSPHPPSLSQSETGKNVASTQASHRRRKRRRRRREHRPRNPTLAETGGLPPVRPEDQPPPPT